MKNTLFIYPDYAEIEIKNKDNVFYCKVDKEDIERIENHSWCIVQGYAYCTIKNKNISMHRLLLNPPKNMQVDHINHNKLDNRKFNLKICTQLENLKNRRFCGDKRIQIKKYESKKDKGITWYLTIVYNRQRHYIGKYKSYDEAFIFGSQCLKNMLL